MTTEYSTELSSLLPESSAAGGVRERSLSIKRMLARRGPWMVLIFILTAIPGMVGAWFLVPLEFEAYATIEISSTTDHVIFKDGSGLSTREHEKFVRTQTELIAGPTILNRVLDDPAVQKLPFLQGMGNSDQLYLLMSKVDARVSSGTDLVKVTFSASDPAAAELVVSEIVDAYLDYAIQPLGNPADQKIQDTLREELKTRVAQIEEGLAQIEALREQADSALATGLSVGGENVSFAESLARAQDDVSTSESEIRSIEQTLNEAKELQQRFEQNPDEEIFAFDVESTVRNDPTVIQVRTDLARTEEKLALLEETYLSDAPKVRVERSAQATLRGKLAQSQRRARAEKLGALVSKLEYDLQSARRALDAAVERREEFKDWMDEYEDDLLAAARNRDKIAEVEDRVAEARGRKKQIDDRIFQLEVEAKRPASIRAADPPTVPTTPEYGGRLKLMLAAMMGGGFLAVAFGLWRELSDQQIQSPQDVGYITSLPVLATIPHVSIDRIPKGANVPTLAADYPASTTTDEVRRILTRILYPPEGSAELNTCLVVSPSRHDGKTTVACNLALMLAQANRRVLLVDISSRKPRIERSFGLDESPGLSEVLCGDFMPSDLVRPTAYPNLFILGPGYRDKDLVGKLASRDAVEFLERAEEAFEHVIVDTPPALLMSDAKLLAPIVDGVIVVVGVGRTTLGMLRRCLQEMTQIGANVIGVVLNSMRHTRGGYLRRNLDLYYADGADDDGRDVDDLPEMMDFGAVDPDDIEDVDMPSIMLVEGDGSEVAEEEDDESKEETVEAAVASKEDRREGTGA